MVVVGVRGGVLPPINVDLRPGGVQWPVHTELADWSGLGETSRYYNSIYATWECKSHDIVTVAIQTAYNMILPTKMSPMIQKLTI